MIDRYWKAPMKALWTPVRKFQAWLMVELAVLLARENLGQIPAGTHERVKDRTWIDDRVTAAIERRDKLINHDLNAFLEIMWLQIILPREEFDPLIGIKDDEVFDQAVKEALAKVDDHADAG